MRIPRSPGSIPLVPLLTAPLSSILLLASGGPVGGEESLPPLTDDQPPRTVEELWAGFDPRAEPLDLEILRESHLEPRRRERLDVGVSRWRSWIGEQVH